MKIYIRAAQNHNDFEKQATAQLKNSKAYDLISSISDRVDILPYGYDDQTATLATQGETSIPRLAQLSVKLHPEYGNNSACLKMIQNVIDSANQVDSRFNRFILQLDCTGSGEVKFSYPYGIEDTHISGVSKPNFPQLLKQETSSLYDRTSGKTTRFDPANAQDDGNIKKVIRREARNWLNNMLSPFASEYGVRKFSIKNIRLDSDYDFTEDSDEAYAVVTVFADGQELGDYQLSFMEQDGEWFCIDTTHDLTDDIREFLNEALGAPED